MSTSHRYWPRYLWALTLFVLLGGVGSGYAAYMAIPPPPDDVTPCVECLPDIPPGDPQTLLLIGSDKRSKTAVDGGRTGELSDTLMLARLDADRGGALLSIPRDTEVQIPVEGGGSRTGKINEAFAGGGEQYAVKAVTDLMDIPINHVVVVNFGAFERAVNRLGCIYEDIDRSYFNDNSGGTNYATIDVPSGYQLLCGGDTLDWVRYRHLDNDLVRGARQQEFLRSVRSQVAASKLLSSRGDLLRIFRTYTRTDINGRKDVLTLLKLAVESAGQPLRSVKFRATETPGGALTATPADLDAMRREFRRLEATKGRTTSTTTTKTKTAKAASRKRPGLATGLTKTADETTKPELVKASFDLAAGGLPVYYPGARLAVGGYAQRDPVRAYAIRASRYSKRTYPAFRLTYSAGEGKYFGQYYGVQGTTWKDAPILRESHTTVKHGGRTLRVYSAGGRHRLVAWVTDDGAYWVSNSVSLALTNAQMLDIAASLTRVPG